MSYKGIKAILYATPQDVRVLNSIFDYRREDISENDGDQEVENELIEQHLYDAGSFVLSYLSGVYSETDFNSKTPYFKGPISPKSNQSHVRLLGLTVGASSITEQWTIDFGALVSGQVEFTVTGTYSGAQGSGNTGAEFTSTNSDIIIPVAAWSFKSDDDTPKPGDFVIVGTYIVHPLIRTVTSYLAASSLMDFLYSESEGSSSSWAKNYYKKAMDLLNKIVDPDSGVGLEGKVSTSVEHEAAGYDIDEYGNDRTEYKDVQFDNLPFQRGASQPYNW